MEKDFNKNNENVIEFISGSHYAVITFTNRKQVNRVKKLYAERKEEFKFFYENQDGSICAKIPLKWVRINPGAKPDAQKRTRTPEQIEAASRALAKWREENRGK